MIDLTALQVALYAFAFVGVCIELKLWWDDCCKAHQHNDDEG